MQKKTKVRCEPKLKQFSLFIYCEVQFSIFPPVKVQVDRTPPLFHSHMWLCLSCRPGLVCREAAVMTPEFMFLFSPSFPV